jgi:hypothetical protein
MDDFMNYMVRPGVLVIAVFIYLVVWTIRKSLESIWPSLRKQAGELAAAPMYTSRTAVIWNELGLHILPVLIGGLVGLIHSEFLHGPLQLWGDRVMFDCGIGWFSGTLYKGVSKMLSAKLGIDIDPTSS